MEAKDFLGAISAFEEKGIKEEDVVTCLKQAFESIFKKKNYEDTRAEAIIDLNNGIIRVDVYKKVVDEVIDDNLEVSLEDVSELNSSLKIGDDYCKTYDVKSFSTKDIRTIISVFKQKIKEVEKRQLFEEYQDKQGELIECEVERVEPQFTLLKVGKTNHTTVKLPNSHKIGNETFRQGQKIKVYLTKVESLTGETKINVSRADAGFLKRLFEETIIEVANGTVIIKDIARQAGQRSKVSVYSNDINVDPVGACIGPGGSKIQAICAQLGSERIDIVQYSEYPGLYIAESLKPAKVLQVKIDEQTKSAVAIVSNEDLRIAIGIKGSNASLAVRLTGWKIDIKEEEQAREEGIQGLTLDQMKAYEQPYVYLKRRNELLAQTQLEQAQQEEFVEENVPSEEIKQVETIKEVKVEPVKEEVKPVVEEKVVEYKPVQMQPTLSLKELEKQIEDEKKKKTQQPVIQKKKVFVEEEAAPVKETKKKPVEEKKIQPQMAIYSDEELEELENEEFEENNYDDETDYSEYDEYYED